MNGERDSITADLDFSGTLGGRWEWEFKSRYVERDVLSESQNYVDSRALQSLEALNRTDPSEALNVFGDSLLTDGNNAAILDAADYRVPYESSGSVNQAASSELSVRRELIRMPGGPVRLAFGGEWRRDSIDVDYGSTINGARVVNVASPVGYTVGSFFSEKGERTQRSGFAELFVPIFSEANAARGLRDLNLTLGGRHDSFDGSSSASEELKSQYSGNVWSAGLAYRPVEAVTLRFNKSTGFRSPDVANGLLPTRITPGFVIDLRGGTFRFASIDNISGGNADLLPEESNSVTSGIEIKPPFLPGLTLRANYHNTRFTNRIAVLNPFGALLLTDATFSLYGFQYTLDENGNLQSFDDRATNIATEVTRGWDYGLDWRFDLGGHSFGFSASAGVKDEHIQDLNTYDMNDPVDLIGTVIPKNRYTGNLFWARWGWHLSLTAYTSSGIRYSYPGPRDFDSLPVETITVMAKTDPALVANFRGWVDLGEFWQSAPPLLEDMRLSFGINNIGKAYDKVKQDPEIGRHVGIVRNAFDARGQLYYLEISKEF
ncbi:MAG: TonB-dependent receptor [Gammaproteobacteria bacterium]|nr:TonB-dependent receptor [Gammaproteobacteria bacterium]